MSKYKVLWFDDEHESLELIKEEALTRNIEMVGFDNATDGLAELENKFWLYDAIIVDGLFFMSAGQVGDSVNQEAFGKVAKSLLKLKENDIVIPWFIYSGQKSFVKEKNILVSVLADEDFGKGRVFDKNNDKDFDELCNCIVEATTNIELIKTRQDHYQVFEACTEKYIGEYAAKDLLSLLMINRRMDIENAFNTVRKIIEDIFLAFNKFNLLPPEFVTPHVSLNESSKFLCGNAEKGFLQNPSSKLPKVICNYFKYILSVSQPGSHRSYIDEHLRNVNTSYLLNCVTFQLMDIIVWFKKYVDTNPESNNWTYENSDLSESSPVSYLIHGTVINHNTYKGFAFLRPDVEQENIFIPPHLVEEHKLCDDMKISVETEQYIDNRTRESRTRAKRIER